MNKSQLSLKQQHKKKTKVIDIMYLEKYML